MRSFNRECSACRTSGAENSYGIAAMARKARLRRMAARGGVSEPAEPQEQRVPVPSGNAEADPGSLTLLNEPVNRSSVSAPAPEAGEGGSRKGTQP